MIPLFVGLSCCGDDLLAFGTREREMEGPLWQAERGQQCGYAMANCGRGDVAIGLVGVRRTNGFPVHSPSRRGRTCL